MVDDFNLSEKIWNDGKIYMGDVKEFTSRLKKRLCAGYLRHHFPKLSNLDRIPQLEIIKAIDELGGEHLT